MLEQTPLHIIEWQIKARARIQTLLFQLLDFLIKHEEFHRAGDEQWYPMMRMVHSGFSLWRSAFLTEAQRNRRKIYSDTVEFLSKIFNQNTITFSDDYRLREITIGYYNADAKYRLERQFDFGSEELKKLPSVKKIWDLRRDRSAEGADQTVLWDYYFEALSDSFKEFKRDWDENVRPSRKCRRGAALAAHAPPAAPE
jgi:hypothetical protein